MRAAVSKQEGNFNTNQAQHGLTACEAKIYDPKLRPSTCNLIDAISRLVMVADCSFLEDKSNFKVQVTALTPGWWKPHKSKVCVHDRTKTMPVCFDNVHAVHGLDDVHSGHAGGAHHQASALDPGVGHKVLEKTKKSITTTPGEGPVRGGDSTSILTKKCL